MTFDEILEQALEILQILQRRGRVSYRALERQFDLDDAYLADLQDFLFPTISGKFLRGTLGTRMCGCKE